MSKYTKRDQEVADEVNDSARFRCKADGCPNQWSVSFDAGRGMCSAHAWAPSYLWPQITQEARDYLVERARRPTQQPPAAAELTKAEKRAILAKLRSVLSDKPPADKMAWAWRVLERFETGELPRPSKAAVEIANAALSRGA